MKFTNSSKRNLDLPSSLFLGNKSEYTELFTSHFNSFYNTDFLPVADPLGPPFITESLPATIEEVYKGLMGLNTKMGTVPYVIPAIFPAIFLKPCLIAHSIKVTSLKVGKVAALNLL